MKPLLSVVIAALFAATIVTAQEAGEAEKTTAWDTILMQDGKNLNDFLWIARPVVVFADSVADPRLEQQLTLLKEGAEALQERDVVVLVDTNPAEPGSLRKALRPRGFMIALVGKEGGVKLRKASPWNVRELTRVIDKMPMRQREVRERREP